MKSPPNQAVEFIKLEVINTIEYYTDKERLPLTGGPKDESTIVLCMRQYRRKRRKSRTMKRRHLNAPPVFSLGLEHGIWRNLAVSNFLLIII